MGRNEREQAKNLGQTILHITQFFQKKEKKNLTNPTFLTGTVRGEMGRFTQFTIMS